MNSSLRSRILVLLGLLLASTMGAAEPEAPLPPTPAGTNTATRWETNLPAWHGHVSYVAGVKWLSSEWAPMDTQTVVALVDLDLQPPRWPVSLVIQTLFTYEDDPTPVLGTQGDYSGVWEINLGVRKVWRASRTFEPFLGGGLSILGASSWDSQDGYQYYQDSDIGLGAWGGGGCYVSLSTHWHLGVAAQYSWGRVSMFGSNLNPGGVQLIGMVGYHW